MQKQKASEGNRRKHQKRISRTDPEAGFLNRPGKPLGQHYLSHQTVDTDHGIILDVQVTPGGANDTTPYLDQIERIHKNMIPIRTATADAAYDFPLAHRVLDDMGIDFFVRPQPRHDYDSGRLPKASFLYGKGQDTYTCPNGELLHLTYLQRSRGSLTLVYYPNGGNCAQCPYCQQCTGGKNVRSISHSYFFPSVEKNYSKRNTDEYQDALRKRQIWCEGTFAAQKREHNLTRVLRRGLEAAEDHCLLSATAMNLRRMIRAAA